MYSATFLFLITTISPTNQDDPAPRGGSSGIQRDALGVFYTPRIVPNGTSISLHGVKGTRERPSALWGGYLSNQVPYGPLGWCKNHGRCAPNYCPRLFLADSGRRPFSLKAAAFSHPSARKARRRRSKPPAGAAGGNAHCIIFWLSRKIQFYHRKLQDLSKGFIGRWLHVLPLGSR